jgi:hypothetical protein
MVSKQRLRITNQIHNNEIESKGKRTWKWQVILSYENALKKNIQNNQTYQDQKDGIKKKINF